MPLFLTPLPSSSTVRHSHSSNLRTRLSASRTQRKRKHSSESESSSPSASSSEDDRPDAVTNPSSLTPDEILQYRLAGLALDKHLPGEIITGWPHKGLSSAPHLDSRDAKKKGKGKAKKKNVENREKNDFEEPEATKGQEDSSLLRLRHFAVLTTILHKCLLEGDVKRAGRAWALMIRMQVGGKSVDLRGTNYWGIGAELLVRSVDENPAAGSDSGSETGGSQHKERNDRQVDRDDRWGSNVGLQRAKDYYERLIIEHPFKRQFSSAVSELDFWPCMVACEVYGVQCEQTNSLKQVQNIEDQDIDEFQPEEMSESEAEAETNNDFGDFDIERRSKERRQKRKDEYVWEERERIRQVTLTAASQIAARLDERMGVPPYSDSHDLLRLRGMLALYIGDLSVPEKPDEDELENEEGGERRLLLRQRAGDYERGLGAREQQLQKSRNCFVRIRKDNGDLDGIPDDLLEDSEHEELGRGNPNE